MSESRRIVEELRALCVRQIATEENAMKTELELMEVVKKLESVRKQWLRAEMELKQYKELLVKSDVAKAALEVQLKHARNQVDVEMRKRYKTENLHQCLQRQMQLLCDVLVHDSKSSICLNDEQKSILATFEQRAANKSLHRSRLSPIDESSFFSHSDISYDRTDDDLDPNLTLLKPLRSRARERRRSSMGPTLSAAAGRHERSGHVSAELPDGQTVEKEVEAAVQALVRNPGGPVGMAQGPPEESTRESAVPADGADRTPLGLAADGEDAQVQMEKSPKHDFVSKTVIRPETCLPCGKRIRFGKMALKCRRCRLVSHPECKAKCSRTCVPGTGSGEPTVSLEALAPKGHPRIPALVLQCVKEIERRGLQERGLYRVPGGERQVKELRDRLLAAKAQPALSEVSDVHVLCGVLKDFLRRLKEPLVTFKLHRNFMAASEMSDEQERSTATSRTVDQLPKTNRDTLACLMLHLHKVMQSPQCQMDQNNLSRVFGPTLVGHGLSAPSPLTIVRDTNTQPKVLCCFLALPEDYWRRVLSVQAASSQKATKQAERRQVPFLAPFTSPELIQHSALLSGGHARNLTRGRGQPAQKFFPPPV
ncbi:rac GTPase-activating protein 1 [Vanacampus margaritifer]